MGHHGHHGETHITIISYSSLPCRSPFPQEKKNHLPLRTLRAQLQNPMRDLQARNEVKKQVMQLQFVVKAKIQEASQLRGRLSDIAPNAPSALKFSVEEVCRAVTPTATCRSRLLDTCTECRSRSHLESSSLGHCQTSEAGASSP